MLQGLHLYKAQALIPTQGFDLQLNLKQEHFVPLMQELIVALV